MSSKVLKFDQSVKNCNRVVDERLENGDDIGALSVLLRIKDNTKNLTVLKDIANLYYDMGLYDESISYWLKYLNYSGKKNREESYNGLAVNYYYLGNISASTYYFNEQFLLKGKTLEITEDMYESFETLIDENRNTQQIKFVYPPESVDYSDVIEEAKNLIVNQQFDKAIEKYMTVEKGSSCYEEARCQLGVSYFMKGDTEKGIEFLKEVLDNINPDNVTALANISSMYSYLGKTELSSVYYRRIKEEYAKNINDYYKIATSSIEHNDLSKAIKYLKKVIDDKPYEISINFMLAIAYYNNGNHQKCLEILNDLLIISESNPIILYYYRKISYIVKNKDSKKYAEIPYFFKLPEDEITARKNLLEEYANKPQKVRKNIGSEEFWELIAWVFYQSEINLQAQGIMILSYYMTEEVIDFFLDKLISPTISNEIKETIIRILCMDGYNKQIGVVNSNLYRKIEMIDIDIKGKNSDTFIGAYAIAFSYVVYNFDYDGYKLYSTVSKMFYQFNSDEKVIKSDITTLASVMLLLSDYEKLNVVKIVADIFGAEKDSVKELLDYIKERYE